MINIDYDKDIIYEIDIDFHNKTNLPIVYSKQYDADTRYIVATVYKDGQEYTIPTGAVPMFCTTKPSGFGVANTSNCTIDNNKILYKMSYQTTSEHGGFLAEFRLSIPDGASFKELSSPRFKMHVEPSALSNETIMSAGEFNVLAGLVDDAKKALADMNGLVIVINTATANANTAATNANSKATLANTATTNANTATGLANTAATNANSKATLADQKATLANNAAINADAKAALANTATTNANTATGLANTAADNANSKATLADQKATLANEAATNANTKATLANTATTNANTATGLANTAATNANSKATLADEKATLANNSASSANTAASNANDKATLATTAATNANTKATLADTAATSATNISNQLTQETLKIYKPSVATYANIATTYPTPLNGWTVVARDINYEYRYNGSTWVNIGVNTAIDTATNTAIGIVKGGKNVSVESDGTLVADVLKDKATSLSSPFITCPTSDDALAHITKIEGETTQVVTVQGKNLFDTMSDPYEYKGTTSVSRDTNSVTVSSTNGYYSCARYKLHLKPLATYTFKRSAVMLTGSNNMMTVIRGSDETILVASVSIAESTQSFVTPSNGVILIELWATNASNVGSVKYSDIQLELGSTATTYEPYIPFSPSPEYPSPLLSAKDFDVVTTGKNFFDTMSDPYNYTGTTSVSRDTNSVTVSSTSSYYSCARYKLHLKPLAKYVLKRSATILIGSDNMRTVVRDGLGVILYSSGNLAESTGTFTTTDTAEVFIDLIATNMSNVGSVKYSDIQLELGSTATTYEPYKSDKLTITKELNKLENGVADMRERLDDKYVKYTHRIGKGVFDGLETNWQKSSASNDSYCVFQNSKKYSSSILCDKFNVLPFNGLVEQISENIRVNIPGDYLRISVETPRLTTLDVQGFKTFLQANPVTFLYELETPIETIVEEPSMLKSYKGTTHLLTTSDPQVTLTADFKSELWARDYLQDITTKSKFDASSEIEFVEASVDADIVTKDTTPILWGKVLKRFNVIKTNLSNLVNAVNELVNGKINKTDIVQTDTVSDTTKVPSSAVTNALGLEVDQLTNNLAITNIMIAHDENNFIAYAYKRAGVKQLNILHFPAMIADTEYVIGTITNPAYFPSVYGVRQMINYGVNTETVGYRAFLDISTSGVIKIKCATSGGSTKGSHKAQIAYL